MTIANTIYAALYSIPPDDRDVWVQVGMALKSNMGEDAWLTWDEWSRQSSAYKEADAKAVWRSIKGNGGITIGSLFHLARENGWQGQEPVLPEPDPATALWRKAQEDRERAARENRALDASIRAITMLHTAEWVPSHPYLSGKGFPDTPGLSYEGALLVPMRHFQTYAVQSVQTITPDGSKKFLAGGRASETVYTMGKGYERWYCEGYATALSVQAALKSLYRDLVSEVWVCFSAGNLAKVAKRGWDAHYVIADHDLYKCGNKDCEHTWDKVGLPFDTTCPQCGRSVAPPAGEKYARQTGLPFWMPPEQGDANDFHQTYGVKALADELRKVLHG